jgi:hypothetical protein
VFLYWFIVSVNIDWLFAILCGNLVAGLQNFSGLAKILNFDLYNLLSVVIGFICRFSCLKFLQNALENIKILFADHFHSLLDWISEIFLWFFLEIFVLFSLPLIHSFFILAWKIPTIFCQKLLQICSCALIISCYNWIWLESRVNNVLENLVMMDVQASVCYSLKKMGRYFFAIFWGMLASSGHFFVQFLVYLQFVS